jgi:hypothetical protein
VPCAPTANPRARPFFRFLLDITRPIVLHSTRESISKTTCSLAHTFTLMTETTCSIEGSITSAGLFLDLIFCREISVNTSLRTTKNNKQTPWPYTDWAIATCRRNLVSTFVDRGVSRGQRCGSPTVVNLSFLDGSRYFFFK